MRLRAQVGDSGTTSELPMFGLELGLGLGLDLGLVLRFLGVVIRKVVNSDDIIGSSEVVPILLYSFAYDRYRKKIRCYCVRPFFNIKSAD